MLGLITATVTAAAVAGGAGEALTGAITGGTGRDDESSSTAASSPTTACAASPWRSPAAPGRARCARSGPTSAPRSPSTSPFDVLPDPSSSYRLVGYARRHGRGRAGDDVGRRHFTRRSWSSPATRLVEDATGSLYGATDTLTVRLSQAPTTTVTIRLRAVAAPSLAGAW